LTAKHILSRVEGGAKNTKNNSRRDLDVGAYHDTPWGGVVVGTSDQKAERPSNPAVFGG